MGMYITENSRMIYLMAKVFINIKMGINTKVSGQTVKKMAEEHLL